MTTDWWPIRVELLAGGPSGELWPPPGRELLVGPRHTFHDLARAIDEAFARWDLGHLWEFTLADGRRVGVPDPDDDPEEDELPLADADRLAVSRVLDPGAEFRYVYDFGDRWVHRCTVGLRPVDPGALLGAEPRSPRPIFGWGTLPDQHGRRWADDDGTSAAPPPPLERDPMLSTGWPRSAVGPVPLRGRDLPELRGATARRDLDAVRLMIEGRDPGSLLQHAGDAVLAVGVATLPETARELARRLRERDDEGDAELADALLARLGGAAPMLRSVPVDLDEVAGLMSGDPAHDAGGWVDLRTGDVWPASTDVLEDDHPDVDEDPDRWWFVDRAGSRETWKDRRDFADGLRPGPLRDRLIAALEGGRGAFRRFSVALEDEPEILTEWRAFGAERERGRARALMAREGFTPAI
jgi:hypothetical protein